MPRVPTYDDNAVGTAPRRPQYERPLDVSQGEKEASVALATVAQAADLVDERIAQDDALRTQAAITEEFAKFSAKERIDSQGRNADGHAQRVAEWWDKTASEYSGALSSRAKRLTGASLQRARTTSLADAVVYQEVQLDKSHTEAFTLAQKAQLDRAIREANDGLLVGGPSGAAQASRIVLNEMRGNAEAFAKTKGKPPEWVAEQMLAASTDVHVGVISQLNENDPKAAGRYYKEHREEIDARLHDKIEGGLRKASAANDATTKADEVWASMGPKTMNDPVDEPKMAAKIREDFANDPDRRRLALLELGQRREMHNRAQAEFTATNTNKALSVFQSTRSVAAVEKSSEYLALTSGEQLKISQYLMNYQAGQANLAAARASQDEAAVRRELAQQTRAYVPFYNAASNPERLAGMSRQQVEALVVQIGPELTSNLLTKWDSITKSESKLAEAKVDRDSMDAVLRDMGMDPLARKGGKAVAAGETRRRMELAVDAAQQAAKKVLTREEKEEVMRKEAAKVVTLEGWLFDDTAPVATLTPDQLAKVKLPTGDAQKQLSLKMSRIYMATGDENFAPTQENLRRFYLRLSEQDGGLGSAAAAYIPRKN